VQDANVDDLALDNKFLHNVSVFDQIPSGELARKPLKDCKFAWTQRLHAKILKDYGHLDLEDLESRLHEMDGFWRAGECVNNVMKEATHRGYNIGFDREVACIDCAESRRLCLKLVEGELCVLRLPEGWRKGELVCSMASFIERD